MERQERIGYSMMGAALLLVLAGTVGFTVDGTTSIEVVTTGGKTVFSNSRYNSSSILLLLLLNIIISF